MSWNVALFHPSHKDVYMLYENSWKANPPCGHVRLMLQQFGLKDHTTERSTVRLEHYIRIECWPLCSRAIVAFSSASCSAGAKHAA